jgi:hypothetical protein
VYFEAALEERSDSQNWLSPPTPALFQSSIVVTSSISYDGPFNWT